MKRGIFIAAFAALTMWGTVGTAAITGYTCNDDGDGAIVCSTTTWGSHTEGTDTVYDLTIFGDQYWGPGHIEGDFITDTELDPNVFIRNSIENDTGFAWTSYHVAISMNKTFTLSNQTIYPPPGDWMTSITQPVQVGSLYIGYVDYFGGTPVPVGSVFDFGYKVSFLGGVAFTQEMTPVPEPGTLLLVLGGLAGLGLAGAVRRCRNR